MPLALRVIELVFAKLILLSNCTPQWSSNYERVQQLVIEAKRKFPFCCSFSFVLIINRNSFYVLQNVQRGCRAKWAVNSEQWAVSSEHFNQVRFMTPMKLQNIFDQVFGIFSCFFCSASESHLSKGHGASNKKNAQQVTSFTRIHSVRLNEQSVAAPRRCLRLAVDTTH